VTSKSEWTVAYAPIDPASDEHLFFDDHQWATIEAATARIIPTDHDPGAREAGVTRFIDHYLSGIQYVFAAADGSGFLGIEGRSETAWRERTAAMQQAYRDGIVELDRVANARFGAAFKDVAEADQDEVLVEVSGLPRPEPVPIGKGRPSGTFLQGSFDEGMEFFQALVLHTRQGFYGDPAYGGNRDRVGWKVIGFPGPESLADTNDCTYSVRDAFALDADWTELIPFLRESR
jgi:gluconate 2-dehydrogenase gamma chain